MRDHVELAYASTGHAAQGRTVAHALVVIDKPADLRNLYVPMTRGTESNHAYLATSGEQTARDVFAQCLSTDWIDRPAHERHAELNDRELHHPGLLDPDRLRQMLDQREQLLTTLHDAHEQATELPRQLDTITSERAVAVKELDGLRHRFDQAHTVIADYDRPLKRRRHADDLATAQQAAATLPTESDRAEARVTALDQRAAALRGTLEEARGVIAGRDDIDRQVARLDTTLDRDVHARARHARLAPTDDLTATLGPRPTQPAAARTWDQQAGELAQHAAAYPASPSLTDLLVDLGEHSLDISPSASFRGLDDGIDLDL